MSGPISSIVALVRGIVRGIRSFHPIRNDQRHPLIAPRHLFNLFRLWGVPFVFLLLYPALTLAQPDLRIAGRIAPPVPGESA